MLFIMMIVLAFSSVDDFNLIKFINDEDDNSNLELIPLDMDKSVYFEENVNVEGVNNSDSMLNVPRNILSSQTSYEEITDNNLENMCSNIENSDFFECLEKTLKELLSNNINDFIDNSYSGEHIKSPENQNNENNLENENSYISTGKHSDKDNIQENINLESQINYINDNNYNLHNIEIFDSNETWMEVIPISKENEKNNEIPSSSRNNSTNVFQNIKLIKIIYTKNEIDLSEMHLLHEKKINGRVEYILNLAFQNLSNIQVITFKNIQHLNLDHNDLSYIPNEIFNLHSLKSLSLENNKISKIPYEINKLQSLKKLNVDKNQLTNVIEINNLLYLSIQYNKIRCLNHVNKIKSLIKLKIDNNYINIDKLNINNLEFLSLSNIKQTSLIFLKNLNKLKILDCSNNKIKNISEININLVYLKCSNNKIESFYITENNLIYLIMDKNEMREFHLNFNFYKKIKALDLNKNKITKFTVKHPDKSKLVKLNLSDNEIERIEENIKYLNLELLDLRNNKLNSESANIIISMKNLKYLDLKGNNIEYLRTIESKILLFLNISKNPIVLLHKDFFDMPCIRRIFMSDLDISASPSLRSSMNNLSVLDISYTKINTFPYVHNSLVSLEFLNLSNCKLKKFPEGINTEKLKKLNLSNNDLKNLPIKFRELKDKQIILDLRNNPLDSFSDRRKLGALDLLEIFYSKILLDDKIYEKIRNIPFKLIYSQRRPSFKIFKFEKSNKVIMKNEYCLHYLYPLLDSDDRGKVITILTFAEKIRTSGFLLFEFLFEKVGKMIKNSEDINNVVNKIYLYLTERYSSKIYKFLKETVDEYKKIILKKSIIKIYGSEQNYNYWIFKFKDILLYNQEKVYFNEDDSLFYDINIILNSFINNINLEVFIEIIKNKIKNDIPIFRAYSLMVKFIRKSGFYKKHKKHGEININNISNDDIRALLRIFQFLY